MSVTQACKEDEGDFSRNSISCSDVRPEMGTRSQPNLSESSKHNSLQKPNLVLPPVALFTCTDRNPFLPYTDGRKSHFVREREDALTLQRLENKLKQVKVGTSTVPLRPATWGAVLLRGHQRARVPSQSPNHDDVFSGPAKDGAWKVHQLGKESPWDAPPPWAWIQPRHNHTSPLGLPL